ncbi:condensation domain-containing protein [Vibrio nigripulchritudo]|uniref:condensation domain-containing protein n=1 Tax=Vibrio nigripulchritudo TaxID=28173 RepID=UPI0003B2297D|nr:Non-ribosomal peptide synthetase module [Vibrio nigripulchritudo SFn118]
MTNNKLHLQEKSGRGNAVTEFEERVWMHHQQNEDGTSQYSAAYHLIGKTNIGRLVAALSKLPQFVPSLNVCYQFDEDAGLLKSGGNSASHTINIEAVDSVQGAIFHLQSKQSTPIALESQSPIQFTVYICEEKEIVLGVISHQILNGEVSWKETFEVLSSLYNHGLSAVDNPARHTQLTGFTPLSKTQDLSVSRLPWIKRSAQDIELVQAGVSEDISSYLQAPVSRKFSTSIQRSSYETRFGRAMSEVEILSATAVLFARYVSESNGLDSLNVFIPVDISQKDHEINGSMIESGLTHLNLGNLNVDLGEAITEVAAHLNSADQSEASFDTVAESAALVTWLVNPAEYLSLEDVEAKKLPVAPLQPKFEISLGVGIDRQGELSFELVTASSVSPHIGAYLFEQFIAYIGGERVAKPVTEAQNTAFSELLSQVNEQTHSVSDVILVEFREALSSENMTKDDDFFDFGGHSLIATRVIGRLLTNHGIEVHINDLFSHPTAAELAKHAKSDKDIEPLDVNTKIVEDQQSDTVNLILAEFKEALASDSMTATDDFFDFGGHSLIATRVIGRLLTTYNIEVNINDLFSYPTAQSLAEHAVVHDSEQTDEQKLDAEVGTSSAPLSFAQNSLWKAITKYSKFGLDTIFNLPFALRFLDEVDEVVFGEAYRDILVRHTGLRSQFFDDNGSPLQKVVDAREIDNYKWFWTSDECEIEDRDEFLKQEAGHAFDLENELPLRVRFIRCKETGLQFLSFLFHHIVLDEWSVNLMMDELVHAYKQRLQGNPPVWRSEPLPFHEFARQQRSSGMNQKHLDYWLNNLKGVPWAKPIFPEDHPLKGKGETSVAEGGWVEIQIEKEVREGLYTLAKSQSASLFNVVYASIATSLHFLGAPEKLIVGTPSAGRLDAEYFDTIGYFTTIVVHLVKFSGVQTVSDLIAQVKNNINESMPYTDIPIDLIEEGLVGGEPDVEGHMFEVFIQLHAKNKFNGALELPNGDRLDFQQVDPDKSESGLGLQFEVLEEVVNGEQVLRVMMSYMSKNYSPAQVKLLSDTTSALFAEFAKSAKGDQLLEDIKGRVIDSETV